MTTWVVLRHLQGGDAKDTLGLGWFLGRRDVFRTVKLDTDNRKRISANENTRYFKLF